jgi:hypothetical protein
MTIAGQMWEPSRCMGIEMLLTSAPSAANTDGHSQPKRIGPIPSRANPP